MMTARNITTHHLTAIEFAFKTSPWIGRLSLIAHLNEAQDTEFWKRRLRMVQTCYDADDIEAGDTLIKPVISETWLDPQARQIITMLGKR